MNVDTMRRIDRLAGVPLCFLASLLVALFDRFRAPTGQPRRVLFVELSEMGSAILADPAMRKMRDRAGAELYFVIFATNAASLELLRTVAEQNVFTLRSANLRQLAADTLRFLVWSRRQRIDTVIDLELFSRFTALLAGLSGAPRRVGFHAFHDEGLYRGAMLTHRVQYNPHIHIARNFVALVNAALAAQAQTPYSKTRIEDAEVELARAHIEDHARAGVLERVREAFPAYEPGRHRLVLINPNASDLLPQRRWPAAYFVQTMRTLLEEHDDLVALITGGAFEQDRAESLRRRVAHARCVNFSGRLRLGELPALYSLAELMLTNDSGPAHFSAVTELRTLVLFGPETPRLYGSLGNSVALYAGLACSPCVSAANHRKTPCRDNVCLQRIEPQAVLERMRAELARPPGTEARV